MPYGMHGDIASQYKGAIVMNDTDSNANRHEGIIEINRMARNTNRFGGNGDNWTSVR